MNVASQKISVVAVIGAGTMGPKIAYRCAVSGLQARLTDKFPQALANGKERIEGWIDKKLGPGWLRKEKKIGDSDSTYREDQPNSLTHWFLY